MLILLSSIEVVPNSSRISIIIIFMSYICLGAIMLNFCLAYDYWQMLAVLPLSAILNFIGICMHV